MRYVLRLVLFTLIVFVLGSKYILAQDTTLQLKAFEIFELAPARPYSRTVLDSNILKQELNQSLGQILKRHSDLFLKDYGSGALSTLSFRGMGAAHTKLYWNNIPLNSNMNGAYDVSLLDITGSNKIEMNYGAASLIDGSGSLGGSVKLSNKGSFSKNQSLSIAQTIASFDSYKTQISFEKSSSSYFVKSSYSYRQTKNDFVYLNPQPDQIIEEQMLGASSFGHQANLSAGYLINPKHRVELGVLYQYNERNLPKLNFQSEVAEFQLDQNSIGYVSWNWITSKFKNELKTGLKLNELKYDNQNLNLKNTGSESGIFVYERFETTIFKKIHSNSAILWDNSTANHEEYGKEYSRVELQLIQDVRYAVNSTIDMGIVLKSHLSSQSNLPFLPSLNAGVKLFKKQVKLNASISYHGALPTLNDLYWSTGGNPNLLPESGLSLDAHLKTTLKAKNRFNYQYKAGGYYNFVQNWILWQPDSVGIWRVSNIGHVKSYGFESHASFELKVRQWNFSAIPRYNYNVSLNVESQKQLVYVPHHSISAACEVSYAGFRLSLIPQFVGNRFVNTSNTVWLPSYSVTDISFSKVLNFKNNNSLFLQFSAFNVFDNPYQNIANRPNPGRNFSLNVRLILK